MRKWLVGLAACAAAMGVMRGDGLAQSKLDPKQNMALVTEGLAKAKRPWKPMLNELCPNSNMCVIESRTIQVRTIGGTVNVLTSSAEPEDAYVTTCAGALAGLAGIEMDAARKSMVQAFTAAGAAGSSRSKIGKVQVDVRKTGSGQLACDFFRGA
mgnify:CR=1 FL=1